MPPVRLATAVVLFETVLAWGYVAVLGYSSFGLPGALRVVGYFALYAVAFAGLSWGLIRRRRWVRAPLIVLQLIFAATGLGFLRTGAPTIGVAMIGLAAACIGFLLAPSTRAALGAAR